MAFPEWTNSRSGSHWTLYFFRDNSLKEVRRISTITRPNIHDCKRLRAWPSINRGWLFLEKSCPLITYSAHSFSAPIPYLLCVFCAFLHQYRTCFVCSAHSFTNTVLALCVLLIPSPIPYLLCVFCSFLHLNRTYYLCSAHNFTNTALALCALLIPSP